MQAVIVNGDTKEIAALVQELRRCAEAPEANPLELITKAVQGITIREVN